MVFRINGNEITVEDELVKTFETKVGYPLTQDEIDIMARGAIKRQESFANVEKEILKSIENYIKVADRLPSIMERIENGEINSE